MKKKVLRITTVPVSLDLLLKGQLKMLNEMYEVVAVSSPGKELEEVGKREGVRTVAVRMERRIFPIQDLKSLFALVRLIRKEKPWMVHTLTPKAGLLGMLAAWMVMYFLLHMVDLKLLIILTIVGLIRLQIESFYGRVLRVMVLGAGSSWLVLVRPRLRRRSVQD